MIVTFNTSINNQCPWNHSTHKLKQHDSNGWQQFEQCSLIMVEESNHQYVITFYDFKTTISFFNTKIHLERLQLSSQTYTKKNTLKFFLFYEFKYNNYSLKINSWSSNLDLLKSSQKSKPINYQHCTTMKEAPQKNEVPWNVQRHDPSTLRYVKGLNHVIRNHTCPLRPQLFHCFFEKYS
jgi:hypothetical protein